MILLGQHGQRQDYHMGLDYIRVAAQTCDQNAPQGAYVCGDDYFTLLFSEIEKEKGSNMNVCRCTACFWQESCLKSMCRNLSFRLI